MHRTAFPADSESACREIIEAVRAKHHKARHHVWAYSLLAQDTVRSYYEKIGAEYVAALDDMLVLDAAICNTDRHYGNIQ
ncbi:MAG: YigZ family protein [Oscillospiraceae bacterium]|nr:YigZ family protein [Oscillospiraceae bacterium]